MSEQPSPGFQLYVTGTTESPRALIVLQEGFGVNAHVRSVADRLSDHGYFVVVPHLYHRLGSPEIAYDDLEGAVGAMATLSHEGLTNDLIATTNFLDGLHFERNSRGVIGFCMGGSVALFAGTLDLVAAAVTFYGGGVRTGRMGLPPLLELAPRLDAPWLGFFGDLDRSIPVADVEALRDASFRAEVDTDVVLYEGADHGFHCDARTEVYNPEAAEDAFTRALGFFRDELRDR